MDLVQTVTLRIYWEGFQMANQGNGSDWVDSNSGETSWINPLSMDYHMKQWNEPKESTKAFSEFFSNELSMSKSIIDIGAGAGAATFYLAERNSRTNFIGIDHSQDLIDRAKETSRKFNLTNLSFDTGDWFNLDKKWGGG